MYSLDSQGCVAAAAAAVDMTSAADGLVFTPGTPVEIISFGYVIATKTSGPVTSAFVASLDKRVTPSSDTGRVTGAFGTLTLTNAQLLLVGAALTAVGVLRSRPAPPTTGESAMVLLPGQQAVFKISTAAAGNSIALTGFQFIEYKNLARGDQAVTKELIVTA